MHFTIRARRNHYQVNLLNEWPLPWRLSWHRMVKVGDNSWVPRRRAFPRLCSARVHLFYVRRIAFGASQAPDLCIKVWPIIVTVLRVDTPSTGKLSARKHARV